MWKCATRSLKATFHKSILRCNTVLSTKVPQNKEFKSLSKFAPALLEHINRYYGFYKSSYRNFSKEKKDKEDPKKRNSILGDFDHFVIDALSWSGVVILGYYFLQPFSRKKLSLKVRIYDTQPISTLSGYQKTVNFLIEASGIRPYNYVLPEIKAAKSKESDKNLNESDSKNLKSEKDIFSGLEKAHQKVVGTLSNWIGTQYMQSGKHKEALGYFAQAAEEENAAGIFNLGICHEKGLGTSQNFKKAADLYQRAANLGHATAMYNLGVFYVQGLGGIKVDLDHARELFKSAANLGQIDALKALKLEKQALGEAPDISLPEKITQQSQDKTLLTPSIYENILEQPKHSSDECRSYNTEFKSISCDSFVCQVDLNSTQDSDSGVLDLSPENVLFV